MWGEAAIPTPNGCHGDDFGSVVAITPNYAGKVAQFVYAPRASVPTASRI